MAEESTVTCPPLGMVRMMLFLVDAPVLMFKFAVVFAVCVPDGDVGLVVSGDTTVVPPFAAKDTYWVFAEI